MQRLEDRRDLPVAQGARPAAVRMVVEPGARHVDEQQVEETGDDGVPARPAAAHLAREQVDGRAQPGVAAGPRGQMDDVGERGEQGVAAGVVEAVLAAQELGTAVRVGHRPVERDRALGPGRVRKDMGAAVRDQDDVPGAQGRGFGTLGEQPAGAAQQDVEAGALVAVEPVAPGRVHPEPAGGGPAGAHGGDHVAEYVHASTVAEGREHRNGQR